MNRMSSLNQAESSRPLALHIIPPLQSKQDHVDLEAAMQSLVLDKRHPIALELAGTFERRSFIVRATTQTALDHVEALLRSQYPQLEVRPLPTYEDPFTLEAYETVSAVELTAGSASYLPLRTWRQENKKPTQEEIDPLLGLLAALSKLPDKTRAIAQIALVPAADNWSEDSLRKAVEHPLEPEKRSERRANQRDMIASKAGDGFATPIIIAVGCVAALYPFVQQWIPDWTRQAVGRMIKGQDPHLTAPQIFQIVVFLLVLLLVIGLLVYLVERIRRFFNPNPIYDMRMVAQKTSRMAYRARVRLYVIGPKTQEDESRSGQHADFWDRTRAERTQSEIREEMLLRLIAAYRQFHQASGAYFLPKRLSVRQAHRLLSRDLQRHGHGWQQGVSNSAHLISVDALAVLWHLPAASVLPELALVEHRRARTMLIPPDLARQSAGLTPLGYSEHGGYRLPFALTPQFFSMHTLIAGKSGEGKSTCMEHIAREAMIHGGLVLIDPHGDLCEHVLHLVPASRADDVVFIDLSDSNASVGINPLDVTLGRGRDKAISDLLKTLAHIWVSSWGPRMENAFEMSLRTLFEANKVLVGNDAQNGPGQQYTLLDVLPLLTNENFCHALLQSIEDDYLHRWWREYYEPLTLMQQRDVINPVITKVAKFESVIARRIIGQSVATLNFTQMIAERKIILLKLAKGVVGADVAALLGATLLGLLQITLEEQGAKAEQERVRFPIILDEFQVLAGIDYGALAELRKYGATFFLATQSLEYLKKLDELLLPTVLANVKQLIIFHMSAKDAETLYQELGVEQEDILNLDMHTCYIKLAAANRRQPTFSLQVSPPPTGDPIQAESIRTRCRVRYTCTVDVIDEKLRDAMIRAIRLAPASGGSGLPPRHSPHGRPPANAHTPSPLVLPASPAHATSPTQQTSPLPLAAAPNPNAAQPRKQKNRGRRSKERAERYRQEMAKRGQATPMAFSEDDEDELELREISTHRKDQENRDDTY